MVRDLEKVSDQEMCFSISLFYHLQATNVNSRLPGRRVLTNGTIFNDPVAISYVQRILPPSADIGRRKRLPTSAPVAICERNLYSFSKKRLLNIVADSRLSTYPKHRIQDTYRKLFCNKKLPIFEEA